MHSVSNFGWSGLQRVLSALFVAQMLSFSLLPLTATMGRSEGYRCTCCPKGKCRCGHGTPKPGGGPSILSSYSCAQPVQSRERAGQADNEPILSNRSASRSDCVRDRRLACRYFASPAESNSLPSLPASSSTAFLSTIQLKHGKEADCEVSYISLYCSGVSGCRGLASVIVLK